MQAYRWVLGVSGVLAFASVVGCKGSLPPEIGGNGGDAPPETTGSGGLKTTGSGGVGGSAGHVVAPSMHRAIATTCAGPLPDAGVKTSVYDGGSPGPFAADGGALTCLTDSDCPPCQNGQLDHCLVHPQLGPNSCACDQCNSDQDCPGTEACVCKQSGWSGYPVGNVCMRGNCRVDADCGPDGFCSLTLTPCGYGGYYCRTPADTCLNDSDCGTIGVACEYSPATGAWGCGSTTCGG
jgi:hypothetical protein